MEVVLILVILVVIGLGIIAYVSMSNDKIHKFVNDSFNTMNNQEPISEYDEEYNYNSTLNTDTFMDTLNYIDKKQDSRIDALLKCLGHIEFWITIIGIYYLIKFIIAIFSIIVVAEGSREILELINQIN